MVGKKGRRFLWHCICECGNVKLLDSNQFQETTSCGCSRRNNLVGFRFGKLIVQKYLNAVSKSRSALWECVCDCGNIITVEGRNLTRGATKSCGCLHCPDLTGAQFGRLTVVGISQEGQGRRVWKCKCVCGKYAHISTTSLQGGHTKSCGCLNTDIAKDRMTTHGHSKSTDPILIKVYYAWSGMRARCNDKKNGAYGKRGITVSPQWRGKNGFENFFNDMGLPENQSLSLERLDVDGPYSPDNCVWGSPLMQSMNQRPTRSAYIDLLDTMEALCEKTEIPFDKLFEALRTGNSMMEIIKPK